jgi:hypothetical protein
MVQGAASRKPATLAVTCGESTGKDTIRVQRRSAPGQRIGRQDSRLTGVKHAYAERSAGSLCLQSMTNMKETTVMLRNSMTTLTFAAACLTAAATIPAAQAQYAPGVQVVTNGLQSSGVELSGNWSPQRNIIDSERYSRLLRTNPQFRAQRMRLECGPVTDPRLHDQCLQSFNQGPG